jgi:hypothetical protein
MGRALLYGIVAGATFAYLAALPATVRVSATLDAMPEELLRQVAEVELEPVLIPFVESVDVEARDVGVVRYRVRTRVFGLPLSARFVKRFRAEEGEAEWRTLEATFGMQQQGWLRFRRVAGTTGATIEANTAFQTPLLGPVLSRLSAPILHYAFSVWLARLDVSAAGLREPAANDDRRLSHG